MAPDVRALLHGCRVFHFDDAGENAPPTRWATVGDDEALRWNGENLAAVLLRLHEESPFDYQRIVEVIRSVAPFFDDFVLRPSRDGIRLRWRQRGVDPVFAGSQLSDGTLRFICLATLLLSPFRPATIVLDEPELGLHPFALHQLAGMIRSAATGGRRVVLATQSVPLVSLFGVNEIAVLEREAGATVVHRPDPETLAAFLDDYSLGTLWEMNLLHGHPAPEV